MTFVFSLLSLNQDTKEVLLDLPYVTTTAILLIAGALTTGAAGLIIPCRRKKADDEPEWGSGLTGHTAADSTRSRTPSMDEPDAEMCWSLGFGAYKYTGLRPSPLEPGAEKPLPLSPSEATRLPLPRLRPGEERLLAELERRVSDVGEMPLQRVDRCYLLRCLRAEKGKLDNAERKIRQSAKWLQENDVFRVFTHWNLEAYEQCLAPWWLSGGFLGHGLGGEPVALERIGRCSWPKLCNQIDLEILKKIDIVHCLRSIAAVEEDALRRSVPFAGATIVMDLKGFRWQDAQFRAAWSLSKLVAQRDILMPETCIRILFVRTPAPFVRAWSMFSYLLDPGTVEKVQMATEEETLSLLKKYLGEDVIPRYLGGQKVLDEDPQCRQIIAPGGLPPPEALQRLERLLSEEESGGVPRPRLSSGNLGGADLGYNRRSGSAAAPARGCVQCDTCQQQ
eukprot:TRINITY_DN17177_c0_g1_i1.p1 TRINITY_DN17177_c0_g1~~TRINITY_DN17177_c0_g1_i1.p1  ORF type:complete len:450 (+),score=81.16 TRINITY_DN17177_c0_g1_i1:60-1409(+)